MDQGNFLKQLSKPNNIIGRVTVKNVMSSHLWLITAFLIFISITAILKVNILVTVIFSVILLILIVHFILSFDHFKKENPKYLLNESTFLKALKIEPLGDKKSIKSAAVVEGEISVESPSDKGKKTKKKLLA